MQNAIYFISFSLVVLNINIYLKIVATRKNRPSSGNANATSVSNGVR